MQCPACTAAMTALTLDGHLGTTVDLDLCAACQVIWFDRLESLRLSPGATLSLFRTIGARKQLSPPPLADPLKCPRCDLRLLLTNDRQRNTPFRYRRCARDHGRLITFFDFLREKDFVRPLSARSSPSCAPTCRSINCSNCGAPVDLTSASACAHCSTPLSMLDLNQIEGMAAHLRQADEASRKDRSDAARAHEAREGRGRFALRGAARGRRRRPAGVFGPGRDGHAAVSKLFD